MTKKSFFLPKTEKTDIFAQKQLIKMTKNTNSFYLTKNVVTLCHY